MKTRILVIFILIAVVAVGAIFYVKNYFYYSKKTEIVKAVDVDKELVLETFKKNSKEFLNPEGKIFDAINAFDIQNFVIDTPDNELIVHFWASWCDPCVNEIPDLLDYLKRRQADISQKKLSVIFVSLDYDIESLNKFLRSFPHLKDTQYLLLMDKQGLFQKTFDIDRVPSTFFIKDKSVEKYLTVVDWKHK